MKKLILLIALFTSFTTLSAQQSILSSTIEGSGKQSLVLIHGMACSSDVWNDFVTDHEDQYEMHLIHFKGFGNKESYESDHLLLDMKDALITYVEKNGLEKPFLMGHSMGGFLSLWAAAERSDLFAGIISVDGIPYFPVLQNPMITAESAKAMVKQMEAAQQNSSPEMMAQQQKAMIASMVATEERRAEIEQMGANSNRSMITQAFGEMFTTDLRGQLNTIEIPVLVFGAWKAYAPYGVTKKSVTASYKSQLKEIQKAELKVAENAYHFIFIDEPVWFNSQVNKFVSRNL